MKTLVRYFVVLSTLIVFSIGHAVEVDQGAVQEAKATFLDRMVVTHGLDRAELTRILDNAEIDEQILETISRPAERVLPWHEYRAIFLNETRISGGVVFWNTHADEIRNVSEVYSVAPELLVAILGVETYYGRRMGSFRVIDSLATLAFAYPPRSEFFTSE